MSAGLPSAPAQGQRDLAVDRPAQLLLDLGQRQVVNRLLVDREDRLAGLDPGGRGRRAVARRHHLDLSALQGDDEPGRADIGLGRRLQRLVFGFAQIGAMRVEARQHPGDRGLDKLTVGDRLDRILTNPLERLAKQVELLVDPALGVLRLRKSRSRREQHQQRERRHPFAHAHQFSTRASAHYPRIRPLQWGRRVFAGRMRQCLNRR